METPDLKFKFGEARDGHVLALRKWFEDIPDNLFCGKKMSVSVEFAKSDYLTMFSFAARSCEEGLSPACLSLFKININEIPQPRYVTTDSVTNAFSRMYNDKTGARAKALKTLSEHSKSWDHTKYYFPGTAVVQSSGSGKSRMLTSMHECGVYVVYCSFLEDLATGYPKRSNFANDLLENEYSSMEFRFLSFYLAAFDLVSTSGKDSTEFFKWQNISDSEEIESDFKTQLLARMEYHMAALKEKSKTSEPEVKIVIIDSLFAYAQEVLSSHPNSSDLRILIVFDEVRQLLGKNNTVKITDSPFAIMRRSSIFMPKNKGFFIVMLDTTATVSNLAPTAQDELSERAVQGRKLFAPIYLIANFDIEVKDEASSSLHNYLQPEYLYRYGRPLWTSLIDSETDTTRVLALACSKLLGGSVHISHDFDMQQLNVARCLSLLRARVPFLVYKSELASKLVAGHLWNCVYISPDRHTVVSTMPSEPIVSEAACHWLSLPNAWKTVLEQYVNQLKIGSVNAGESGEVAAAIICLLARDRVVAANAKIIERS